MTNKPFQRVVKQSFCAGSQVMWVFLAMKTNGHDSEVCPVSLCVWKSQLLILFLVLLSISEKWLQLMNSCTRNKLQASTVYQQKSSLSRRDEVAINRLRIGHTRCTHSYLLTGADQPECTTCQCPLTVKHILVECTDFNDNLNKYFVASSTEELFRETDVWFYQRNSFFNKLWWRYAALILSYFLI